MSEVWLRSNVYALRAALIPLALVALAGGLVAALASAGWLRWGALAVTALALAAAAVWTWLMGRPRLSYNGRELLVNLRAGRPIRLPLEAVECCFLGQRPAQLGGRAYAGTKMAAVVLRLSERATQWASVPVEPSLGQWQDGYVTLYGTWCEPLNLARVNHINERLRAAQQTQRDVATVE